ncbi:MAG: ABC transporter ATP-binding protein [Alphaproteobacteria bacterium]
MALSGGVSRTDGSRPLLEVEDVHVRYGARAVIAGVSLAIRPGEIYGLLGPNGAGKSTLMKAICGRARLSSGHIIVRGKPVRAGWRSGSHVGRVSQQVALFDHLTVRENLTTFARLFGLGGRRLKERVRDVTERFDLGAFAGTVAARLSGGQRQRLHIAVTLLTEPDVLMLDEPTVGVDLASKQKLYAVLNDLARDGMAIVVTTHDLPEARILSDRVGILVDGRLVAEGPPDVLIEDHFKGLRRTRICIRPGAVEAEAIVLSGLGLARIGATEWTGFLDEARDLPSLFDHVQRYTHLITELVLSRPDLEDLFGIWQQGEAIADRSEDDTAGPSAGVTSLVQSGDALAAAMEHDFLPEDVCPDRALERMVP